MPGIALSPIRRFKSLAVIPRAVFDSSLTEGVHRRCAFYAMVSGLTEHLSK